MLQEAKEASDIRQTIYIASKSTMSSRMHLALAPARDHVLHQYNRASCVTVSYYQQ